MSRTRKTDPWWVRQNRAVKTNHDRARARHNCGHSWTGVVVECDAYRDDVPRDTRNCDRMVSGRHRRWDPYETTARERSNRYWEPERTAVSGSLHRITRQAFADPHDVDDSDVLVQQHRHGTWGGGWWD